MANESCSKDETLQVTTLIDLKKRREKLLEVKKMILRRQSAADENTKEFPKNLPNTSLVNSENQEELPKETEALAYCDTTTFSASCLENLLEINDHDNVSGLTVTSTNNLVSNVSKEDVCTEINNELSELGFDFSSDDSVADPNYFPLSEITNVAPIASTSTDSNYDLFPEAILEREVAIESRVRKRKADVMSTKRLRNKTLRMLGQEYVGFRKTGDEKFSQDSIKPARQLGQPCNSSKCLRSKVFHCDKFTETVRLNIFNEFWKLAWIAKKMFVSSLVDRKTTKRKTTNRVDTRRSATKVYYLKLNDQKMRVCLKTFLGTLGIKEWTVRYWLGEKSNKESSKGQRDVALPQLKELVQIFLRAMPKMPSHYCRKESTKLYLEPIIQSKRELYRIYVKEATKTGQKVASRKLFEDVLKDENIALFQPKKDACDLCCSYKAGNITEEIYQQHVSRKDLARQEKTLDKEAAKKGMLHVVTADLQAVKLCPFLKASALYFKTKLMVHNFTVYNLGTNDVKCYWFDETASDLKAPTYASFFVDYLKKLIEESPKNVVIFTNGCTSQNRNVVVSNALLQLAMEKKVVIKQKFLEKGHTQMEVDSVHSVIERKLKHREIFLPSQYSSVTKEARLNPSPYEVVTADHTFFKDYSIKSNLIYDTIRPGRGTGAKCVVDIRVLKYNPNGTIEYKLNYNDEFQPLPQRPKKVGPVIPPQLFTEKLPITKSKYEHLQQLKSVIPIDCHEFYDNLPYKSN